MFYRRLQSFACLLIVCLCVGGCRYDALDNPPPNETSPRAHTFAPIVNGVWQTMDCNTDRVGKDRKLAALTFDDAPTAKLDELLEVFLEFNQTHPDRPATATLFCNGRGLSRRTKESLFTAFTMGFELGNHSFSHHDLTTLSTREIDKEIERVDTLLEEIDGKPLHLFRAPYGRLNEKVKAAVKTPIIDWYIDTKDWAEQSAEKLIERAFSRLQDGAILLMHDGYESTVDGVKQLLPALYEVGYQAVSVSQMAEAHGCALRVGGVYTRARKQYKIKA